jgi:hypothetical protein
MLCLTPGGALRQDLFAGHPWLFLSLGIYIAVGAATLFASATLVRCLRFLPCVCHLGLKN